MDAMRLMPILVAMWTAGCATVGAPASGAGSSSLAVAPVVSMPVDEPLPMPLAEIGRPLTPRNAHAKIDWAGALGFTKDRVRSWPGVRTLRSVLWNSRQPCSNGRPQ